MSRGHGPGGHVLASSTYSAILAASSTAPRPTREGTEGDFKLYGTVLDVREPDLREADRDAIYARIGWAPEEPGYHLFALDVATAGFVIFGKTATAWPGIRRVASGAGRSRTTDEAQPAAAPT